GQTYHFRVTGAVNVGTVWGTGVYTSDSPLATVAVHAGLLKVGQTGVIKVTIVPAQAAYMGSTQNGVPTNGYGGGPGADPARRWAGGKESGRRRVSGTRPSERSSSAGCWRRSCST